MSVVMSFIFLDFSFLIRGARYIRGDDNGGMESESTNERRKTKSSSNEHQWRCDKGRLNIVGPGFKTENYNRKTNSHRGFLLAVLLLAVVVLRSNSNHLTIHEYKWYNITFKLDDMPIRLNHFRNKNRLYSVNPSLTCRQSLIICMVVKNRWWMA